MSRKWIAIDLDGTLLRSNGEISDFSKQVICEVKKQGHQIILTTGRPYRMSYHYYRELHLTEPMINFNGSLLHLPERKWEQERSITLNKRYLIDLLERRKEFGAHFIASEYRKKFYITHDYRSQIDPGLFGVEEITADTRLEIDKITRHPNAVLIQTNTRDKYELAEDLRRDYKGEIEISPWGGELNILECCAKGVNKAAALFHLMALEGKSYKDLIAFGDELNDLQMLDFAGCGYAMSNANPLLHQTANEVLSFTNDEDGVAKKLKELFL